MEGMGGAYVKRLTYNYDSKESTGSMYVHEVTREQFKETTHVPSRAVSMLLPHIVHKLRTVSPLLILTPE